MINNDSSVSDAIAKNDLTLIPIEILKDTIKIKHFAVNEFSNAKKSKNIKNLSDQSNRLRRLDSSGCSNLQILPELLKIEELKCSSCPDLQILPKLGKKD